MDDNYNDGSHFGMTPSFTEFLNDAKEYAETETQMVQINEPLLAELCAKYDAVTTMLTNAMSAPPPSLPNIDSQTSTPQTPHRIMEARLQAVEYKNSRCKLQLRSLRKHVEYCTKLERMTQNAKADLDEVVGRIYDGEEKLERLQEHFSEIVALWQKCKSEYAYILPAPERIVASLPWHRLSENDASTVGEACCVCEEKLTANDFVSRLSCLHPNHARCICEWLIARGTKCQECELSVIPDGEDEFEWVKDELEKAKETLEAGVDAIIGKAMILSTQAGATPPLSAWGRILTRC